MRKQLKEKIERSEELILAQAKKHNNNYCVLCSFGKDSLVLLWLFLSRGHYPPVVFYRDAFFPYKYDFAQKVLSDYNIVAFNYPPIRLSMLYGKGIPALVSEYHMGEVATLALPKNIVEYEKDASRPFICGVDFFSQPVGTFTFPWKLAFLGHKDCDSDQIYGDVPLKSEILYRDVGPNYCYPLKEWTNGDVWDYIEHFDVPVQDDRYDWKNRCEWPDKTFNSDYFPACIRCLDKRLAGKNVYCPKMQIEIPNVSESVTEFVWEPDYFGEQYARE